MQYNYNLGTIVTQSLLEDRLGMHFRSVNSE